MKKCKALVVRILKELIQDKKTILLIFIAPVIILFLMNIIFNANRAEDINIATYGIPQKIIQKFPSKVHIDVLKEIPHNKNNDIRNKDYAAYLQYDSENKEMIIDYSNINPTKTIALKNIIHIVLMKKEISNLISNQKELINQLSIPDKQKLISSEFNDKINIKSHYLYGDSNDTFFTKITPILIGFFVFLFVFLISGIGILKERTSGTLQRMLVTPIRRSIIIFSYTISYGIIAILQTLVIVFFSIKILNLEIVGSIYLIILVNILIALVALTMGLFISTFAKSQFQMMQFIPIIVVPQIFFAGIIPYNEMNHYIQIVGDFFPLKYGGQALCDVVMKGYDFKQILPNIIMLILFIIIFYILNVIGLKKYRSV